MTNFGIPYTILTDNGLRFTFRFFSELREELSFQVVSTTEYHPQANGKVKRFNATIIPRLIRRVADYQNYRDTFVLLLRYASNVQIYGTTVLPPISLSIS